VGRGIFGIEREAAKHGFVSTTRVDRPIKFQAAWLLTLDEFSMTLKPLILLSNDDGVSAEGLRSLREALLEFFDVVVVAPEFEQSATSHALSLHRPLRHRKVAENMHAVDGTPVDCVQLATHLAELLPRTPTLVLSGVNHGTNLGTDVFYSGTVAAAREGALRGIPAIAFSQDLHADHGVCWTSTAQMAVRIVNTLLATLSSFESPHAPLLNINFPAQSPKGIRYTRLGRRIYENVVTARHDPKGRIYYWIGGSFIDHAQDPDVDTTAHAEGFVSVSLLSLDMSRHDAVFQELCSQCLQTDVLAL